MMLAIKKQLLMHTVVLLIVTLPNHLAYSMNSDNYADSEQSEDSCDDDGNASMLSIEDAEAALAVSRECDDWYWHPDRGDEDEEVVEDFDVYEGTSEEYLEEVAREELAEFRRFEQEYLEQQRQNKRRIYLHDEQEDESPVVSPKSRGHEHWKINGEHRKNRHR